MILTIVLCWCREVARLSSLGVRRGRAGLGYWEKLVEKRQSQLTALPQAALGQPHLPTLVKTKPLCSHFLILTLLLLPFSRSVASDSL